MTAPTTPRISIEHSSWTRRGHGGTQEAHDYDVYLEGPEGREMLRRFGNPGSMNWGYFSTDAEKAALEFANSCAKVLGQGKVFYVELGAKR